ncbi:MAG: ABC transporter permease [Chloroflexota bacterium]|nr:ABC transporter permease [Chloroflexota bacterium]
MLRQQRAARRLGTSTGRREQRVTNLWQDAFGRLLRNRAAAVGGIIVLLLIFLSIFADVIAPYHYATGDSEENYMVPLWLTKMMPGNMEDYATIGSKFTLGADYLGRDLLSRIIYGTRVSLPVGFIGATTALIIGLVYGSISGYYGGKVDTIMMRIVEIVYAFPTMLLIILLMAFFKTTFGGVPEPGTASYTFNQINEAVDRLFGLRGGGIFFIFMGIGITAWMGTARLARGQILSLKEKEFIEASRMIGASDLRIIVRHILPNIIGPILVSVTLNIPRYINTEVFLSFIGLGVDPPTPSWGSMISEGAKAIRSYPNQVLFPAIALSITMFAFNFLGDGLRDALDPRMRGTQ